jgi:hypothetical protein
LVLSSRAYHQGQQEVVVAAVTSNVDRVLFGEFISISMWEGKGKSL